MMIIYGSVIGTTTKATSNSLYQSNHTIILAQAKVFKLCYDLLPNAIIGPAPNISVTYPTSSKLKTTWLV
jgi:6-phospho-beta-glucosidase